MYRHGQNKLSSIETHPNQKRYGFFSNSFSNSAPPLMVKPRSESDKSIRRKRLQCKPLPNEWPRSIFT